MTQKAQDEQSAYRDMCANRLDVPLFLQPWWLDLVCGGAEHWGVATATNAKGDIVAALAFWYQKFWGFRVAYPPSLTPYAGVWFPSDVPLSSDVRRDLMRELIAQLPKLPYIEMKLLPEIEDWIPFFRVGFRQTTKYTYLLLGLSDLEVVYADFSRNVHRAIKKCTTNLDIRSECDPRTLHRQYLHQIRQTGGTWNFSEATLLRLYEAAMSRGQCHPFSAYTREGVLVCSYLFFSDGQKMYSLVGTAWDEGKQLGAQTGIIWEAIRLASQMGLQQFDFEGSMLPGVEEFFRRFGGKQTPCHHLVYTANRWIGLLAAWKGKI